MRIMTIFVEGLALCQIWVFAAIVFLVTNEIDAVQFAQLLVRFRVLRMAQ